jgi:DNA-binding SARP family transcriptional activator
VANLQVRVFGKLRLRAGQCRVETFPTRRAEELLAYLLVHQRARHSREKLVDTLWPESDLSNGRASLSTTLWRLRSVFDRLDVPPGDYLQSGRDWVSLAPLTVVDSDHSAFERELLAAERTGDEDERQRRLSLAVALYRGPFCEGIYSEWCLRERERLERLYLRAQGQLMAGLMRKQRYDEAIDAGQAILDADPLREEVHRALMRCYWKLDRRSEAAEQFQRCAQMLQSELQVLPMPETIALYRGIVEERLGELGTDRAGLHEMQLQVAFANFLTAAQELEDAIAAAKVRQQEPSLSSGD